MSRRRPNTKGDSKSEQEEAIRYGRRVLAQCVLSFGVFCSRKGFTLIVLSWLELSGRCLLNFLGSTFNLFRRQEGREGHGQDVMGVMCPSSRVWELILYSKLTEPPDLFVGPPVMCSSS